MPPAGQYAFNDTGEGETDPAMPSLPRFLLPRWASPLGVVRGGSGVARCASLVRRGRTSRGSAPVFAAAGRPNLIGVSGAGEAGVSARRRCTRDKGTVNSGTRRHLPRPCERLGVRESLVWRPVQALERCSLRNYFPGNLSTAFEAISRTLSRLSFES